MTSQQDTCGPRPVLMTNVNLQLILMKGVQFTKYFIYVYTIYMFYFVTQTPTNRIPLTAKACPSSHPTTLHLMFCLLFYFIYLFYLLLILFTYFIYLFYLLILFITYFIYYLFYLLILFITYFIYYSFYLFILFVTYFIYLFYLLLILFTYFIYYLFYLLTLFVATCGTRSHIEDLHRD